MQHDCLGWDHASTIRDREVSLVRRSGKYTFLWPIVWHRWWMSVLQRCSEACDREVPLHTLATIAAVYNEHNYCKARARQPCSRVRIYVSFILNKVWDILLCVHAHSLWNNSPHPKAPLQTRTWPINWINNVQSMDRLTNKPNAMESTQSYPYYSRQVCCSSVETWSPAGGSPCSDMNKETCMDDQ